MCTIHTYKCYKYYKSNGVCVCIFSILYQKWCESMRSYVSFSLIRFNLTLSKVDQKICLCRFFNSFDTHIYTIYISSTNMCSHIRVHKSVNASNSIYNKGNISAILIALRKQKLQPNMEFHRKI